MIAAGLGCRAACCVEDILAAIREALAANGRSLAEVRGLYSADFKSDLASLRRAAEQLDKPLHFLSRSRLEAQATRVLTRSEQVLARFALPSIAEAAALAGALELGPDHGQVRLLSARRVAGGATCALASSGAHS